MASVSSKQFIRPRALRRYKPDPIPDQVIAKVLEAAIRAPSAGNGQNWLFLGPTKVLSLAVDYAPVESPARDCAIAAVRE